MATASAERCLTAFLDGPDSLEITNIIHSTQGAAAYGFRGALVGGVTVYGWCARPILEVLGEGWLAHGWADVSFRRPVYPGDEVCARVETIGEGRASLELVNQEGEVCVAGTVGLGKADWLDDLRVPQRRTAEPRPDELEALTMESAPVGQDLRPMPVPLTLGVATEYAREKQQDEAPPWVGPGAVAHPGWIAARMTPMIRHSYEYGPSIHTRSLIQHLRPIPVGQTVTVAGHFVETFERKGHHYGVVDGVIVGEDGTEYTRIRHTTIFRPAPPPDYPWLGRYAATLARTNPDRPFAVPVRHGSMFAGVYAPRGKDQQSPHDQDEVYVITAGTGTFVRGDERVSFGPGDLLFVPAEMEHRFEAFSDDFACWALFWGPKGGEPE